MTVSNPVSQKQAIISTLQVSPSQTQLTLGSVGTAVIDVTSTSNVSLSNVFVTSASVLISTGQDDPILKANEILSPAVVQGLSLTTSDNAKP